MRGSRLTIIVEPNGTIVRANTPHVQDGRVTLLDIEPERLTSDEVAMKMQGARTNEEMQAVLNEAAGVVMAVAPEVIIEFTPTR